MHVCTYMYVYSRVVQWNLNNVDTIGATWSVLSKEVSILRKLVGVAMRTHAVAVERYEGTFQSSPLLYASEKG